MIGKKYSLGDTFNATGEQLVKIANFEELDNGTEEIRSFLKSFKPDPQYMYLHVIAMGAGEYWGKNINSDYFPEADLIARHKTFETDAKVFHEHDNKAYSKSYGKVAYAWYNPEMHRVELILAIDKVAGKEFVDRVERGERLAVSMGCFPAGTDVLLADNTFKHIEDIVPGDKVITHLSNIRPVVTKMVHEYTGDMYKFKISGIDRELEATKEHPILIRRYTDELSLNSGECPVCKQQVYSIRRHIRYSKDKSHKEFLDNFKHNKYTYEESWVEAKDVKVGDYVITPTNISNKNSKEESLRNYYLSKIIGYWLAEGSYIKRKIHGKKKIRGLSFSFSKKENEYVRELSEALYFIAGKYPNIYQSSTKNEIQIHITCPELANYIYKHCNEGSYTKCLDNHILKFSKINKLILLAKYIEGDGHYDDQRHILSFSTKSKSLAYGIQKLAATSRVTVNISKYKMICSDTLTYQGVINKLDITKIQPYCSKLNIKNNTIETIGNGPNKDRLVKEKSFIHKNNLVHKILAIETYHVDNLPVYNLSVEGDESYTANSIAVHNCRVKADYCSICGNKASKPSDYCDHIKYHKGEIFPDGKQAYMINYNPTFFD